MTIPGLPNEASEQLLLAISAHPLVQRVVLYGSRALGRQRSGSDVDLCLHAPERAWLSCWSWGRSWMICCCPGGSICNLIT